MFRISDDMKPYPKYLDWLRYICAFMLYTYGISKLTGHQFTVSPEVAQKPIGSLSGYTLTWYYFGYSHTYRYILGSIQIAGASLLLFRKSALLAAAMMIPVMANIMLINIFYFIAVGAEFMAAFVLVSMLLLLWHQRAELLAVVWSEQSTEQVATRKRHWQIRALVLLVILTEIIFFSISRR